MERFMVFTDSETCLSFRNHDKAQQRLSDLWDTGTNAVLVHEIGDRFFIDYGDAVVGPIFDFDQVSKRLGEHAF